MTDEPRLEEVLTELERLEEKATKGPWNLCAHLRKAPCGCGGNRGFVYGPGEDDDGLVLDMYHEEDRRDSNDENSHHGGAALPSRERVLVNAALIVALRNHAKLLLTAARRAGELEKKIADTEAMFGGGASKVYEITTELLEKRDRIEKAEAEVARLRAALVVAHDSKRCPSCIAGDCFAANIVLGALKEKP